MAICALQEKGRGGEYYRFVDSGQAFCSGLPFRRQFPIFKRNSIESPFEVILGRWSH
jgi:hypothetical protein